MFVPGGVAIAVRGLAPSPGSNSASSWPDARGSRLGAYRSQDRLVRVLVLELVLELLHASTGSLSGRTVPLPEGPAAQQEAPTNGAGDGTAYPLLCQTRFSF